MKNITILLGSAGILMIIGATIRWSVVFFDMSQLVLASMIGVIFLGFAFFYERLTGIYEELIIIKDLKEKIKQEVIEELSG